MLTILNNFTKYNFIIRTFISIIYDFRIREIFDLLRIKNLDFFTKTKTVIIIIYFVIIKNIIVKNDSSID